MGPAHGLETDGRLGSSITRAALAVLLFGGTLLVGLNAWIGLGSPTIDDFATTVLYDAVVFAAVLACLLRARAVKRERWAWTVLAAGIFLWAAGEVYWNEFILNDPEAPYPSPADALYLGFYPLAAAGLVLLVRTRIQQLNWRLWADGLIAALGTAAVGAVFVFDFVADRTSGTQLEVAVSLAYPLGDILMIAMIMGVVALTGWRPDRTWTLLLAGLAAMGIADIAYSIQSTGGVVPAGN
jgi:diguanylate cyclase